MYEGITSTNKLGTLPGTRLYGRYTGKYRRALRSSSGCRKKFSGRFTGSVPKRHAHHRFDSRVLLDKRDRPRNVDMCPDPFLSWAQFTDLADFNLAVALQISKSAKFYSPQNFPAIRYIMDTACVHLFTWFTEWMVYVLHLEYRLNRLCMTEICIPPSMQKGGEVAGGTVSCRGTKL